MSAARSPRSDLLGLVIEPNALVDGLAMGERQRVEIVRAPIQEPALIILDEPTSVLPPVATPRLFDTIRKLAASGCAVLFISHKLAEIRELCHKATIMRRGQNVATVDPTAESEASLAWLMIGRDIPHPTRDAATRSAGPVLSVRSLSIASDDPFAVSLNHLSLELFGAEIVGIILISDELKDLLDVSDRLHVLFRGRLSPPILRADASVDRIGAYMAGERPVMRVGIPA